jgi:CelD/BcsL family acetyltransferase involved in cellulose biosynthesis
LKVKELNEFDSLKNYWASLPKNSITDNNIFLTWEWLSTWWKYFGKDRKLLILLVEDANKILAIAPLMLSKYKPKRFIPTIRKVEFLGYPQSDYNNFIILEKETECLRSIINYLHRDVSGWDWIELKEIPESTLTLKLFQEIATDSQIKLRKNEHTCSICPYVSLPESLDTFLKKLSVNVRHTLRRNLRKLEQSFLVEFKNYKDFGFSLDEAMRLFFRLHEMRWKERGSKGVFEKGGSVLKDFHLSIAKCFAENGWLSLNFLALNSEPVSAVYSFEYGQKVYGYLTGFDPKYSAYSIGNISLLFLINDCIKRGLRELDMLRGAEAYKNYWTNTCRRNFEIRLGRTTPLSMIYELITRIYSIAR